MALNLPSKQKIIIYTSLIFREPNQHAFDLIPTASLVCIQSAIFCIIHIIIFFYYHRPHKGSLT